MITIVNWRAGASQPSRTTGTIFYIYIYIYRSLRAPIPNKRNVNVILQCWMQCACAVVARHVRALHLYYSWRCAYYSWQLCLFVGFHKQPVYTSFLASVNSSIIFCRILLGSLPLANNVQHSASMIIGHGIIAYMQWEWAISPLRHHHHQNHHQSPYHQS